MEEIIQILKSDPDWERLMNEYEGPFIIHYTFHDVDFIVFNEVGGYINVSILESSLDKALKNVDDVRQFARTAIDFFSSHRNNHR